VCQKRLKASSIQRSCDQLSSWIRITVMRSLIQWTLPSLHLQPAMSLSSLLPTHQPFHRRYPSRKALIRLQLWLPTLFGRLSSQQQTTTALLLPAHRISATTAAKEVHLPVAARRGAPPLPADTVSEAPLALPLTCSSEVRPKLVPLTALHGTDHDPALRDQMRRTPPRTYSELSEEKGSLASAWRVALVATPAAQLVQPQVLLRWISG